MGDLEIRFGKYEVRLRGEVVALSSREIELIELLASDPGAVFTRDQILETLWGSKEAADPNSITVMVRKIREKIEDDPSKPRYLVTVWRVATSWPSRCSFAVPGAEALECLFCRGYAKITNCCCG